MKAIVYTKYGPPDVLQLKEVEKPTPKDNEVLIKVFTVVVGIEDTMQREGKPYFGIIAFRDRKDRVSSPLMVSALRLAHSAFR